MDIRNVNIIYKINSILNNLRTDLTNNSGRYKFKIENDVDFLTIMSYESSSIHMTNAFNSIIKIMRKDNKNIQYVYPDYIERWEIPKEYLNKIWLGLRKDFNKYVAKSVSVDGFIIIRAVLSNVELLKKDNKLFITCKIEGQYVRK